MDPVTMMIASIGMQFFNNYANNKKSSEIQAQQHEFQKAAQNHDFDRMRKAQAAAAKLALDLELEVHEERIKEIEDNYDSLLASFANSFTISNWPLNVLPFIMKGESFGSLFGGTAKSISIHCILTPSNCFWFNESFYDDLDLRLEAEMNNNWNAQSSHPIVYYGGGWNRRQNKPNDVSIPSLIDLDDITLLKNKLEQIPTVVLTPYFDPYLHFRVQLWGMGKDSETPFRIDIPHGEIEPSSRIFSYDYNKDKPELLTDDFFNTTMEEFVPYLEKLIGFIADKYFWSMYGINPSLPYIAKKANLPFCKPSQISKDYMSLIESSDKNLIVAHGTKALLGFINESLAIDDDGDKLKFLIRILCQVCNSRCKDDLCNKDNIEETISSAFFTIDDIPFLKGVLSILKKLQEKKAKSLYSSLNCVVDDIINYNNTAISRTMPYITLHSLLDMVLKEFGEKHDDSILVLDLLPEKHVISISFVDVNHSESDEYVSKLNIKTFGFLVPLELKQQNPKRIRIKKSNIHSLMNKITFDCDINMFQSIISMDDVIEYCNKVIDDVQSCNLYIKDELPKDVVKNVDSNILPNLMYCEIIGRNGIISNQLFYFDEMVGQLKDKFSQSNNLTIE